MKAIKSVALLAAFSVIFSFAINAFAEKKSNTVEVMLETDLGTMKIELYADKAPITVENFLEYVDSGFYNGTIFHRVIPDFMVQGGGLTYDFARKQTRDNIKNESKNGLKNKVGTLSMARLNDPDSASAQFFINVKDNPHLDATTFGPGYTVFGKVVEGYEVVKKIEKEPRGLYNAYPEAPNYPVRILKAYRVKPVSNTNTPKAPAAVKVQ
ncbi:peptidylprolyl isomerase [Teredinibacter sp. KSP-S5-2]|uniref:peptidylprolyl isomerase n=1 Tax=Teredinibacter sp. KSP-S5-2 TaxID=3034506 RepID=UPI0029349890|nr:peptidylprolyl isomerase [Teredinibacter sp. KSP-S5-2]WNO11012.1 peptidylprolyl isomerase [Teredinibacter sp. KSP-S5-2]